MKKSLCIETLFLELPFYERFRAVRDAGFSSVEFGDWTELDLKKVEDLLKEYDLELSAMAGARSHSLGAPEQRDDFLEFLSQSIAVAKSFGCRNLVIATDAETGSCGEKGVHSQYTRIAAATRALMDAVAKAERAGLMLLLKPVSTDCNPDSSMHTTPSAGDIVRVVNSPNLRLLYDVTQMQAMEGDIIRTVRKYRDVIGYVHIGDLPGKGCEINLELFKRVLIEELRYDGYIGFALRPVSDMEGCLEAMRWF